MGNPNYVTNAYLIFALLVLAMFSVLALCQLFVCCCNPAKKSNPIHGTYQVSKNCNKIMTCTKPLPTAFCCNLYYGSETAMMNSQTTQECFQDAGLRTWSNSTTSTSKNVKRESPPPAYEDVFGSDISLSIEDYV